MDDVSRLGNFLLGMTAAAIILVVGFGLPQLLRSGNKWMTAALFGSLTGWRRAVAPLVSGVALLWLLILAGALYSPLAELGPEALPFGGGDVARVVRFLPFGVLAVAVPLSIGLGEAAARGERGRKLITASGLGFLRLGAIALAVVALMPWVVWQKAVIAATRQKRETFRAEIEAGSYAAVAEALRGRFDAAGLRAHVAPASSAVRFSRWLIKNWGPPAFRPREPYSVKVVEADGVSLTVYANLLDLVCEGRAWGRARRAIIGQLPPEGLWWTRSKDARKLEEAILQRNGAPPGEDIGERLAGLDCGSDEWYALYREYLLVAASGKP